MFNSKFVKFLLNSIPDNIRDKFIKYAFIVGFDKLAKKDLIETLDLGEIKQFTKKIKSQGRLTRLKTEPDNSFIRQEILNLRKEISRLANKIDSTQTSDVKNMGDKKSFSQQQKNAYSQIAENKQQQDMRKRSSSMDYRKMQNLSQSRQCLNKKDDITPKVTEVIPQQIFQNFNINIQKHHLDDTEIKGVFQNQYMLMLNSANKKNNQPLRQKPPINKSMLSIPINNHMVTNQSKAKIDNKSQGYLLNQQENHSFIKSDQNHSKNRALSIKEQYENSLLMQVNKKINFDGLKQSTSIHPKNDSKRKSNSKRVSSDPKGSINLSDLPYKQVQPESKIKSLIQESKKAYQDMKTHQIYTQSDQQDDQTQNPGVDSTIQQENTMNTANFSNKQLGIHLSEHNQQLISSMNKYHHEQMIDEENEYQQGEQNQNFNYKKYGDNLYKSTVTSLMNDDDSYLSMNKQNQSNMYIGSNYGIRIPQQNQFQFQNNQQPNGSSSNQYSQQQSKRSGISKEENSQGNSPQVIMDNNFSLRDRGSKSLQKNQLHPQFSMNLNNQQQTYQNSGKDQNKNIQTHLITYKNSAQSSDQKMLENFNKESWERSSSAFNFNRQLRSGGGKDIEDYNRSSVSSNFSVFNPNEDLKTFFQNDFIERQNINLDKGASLSSSHTSEAQQGDIQLSRYQQNKFQDDKNFNKKKTTDVSQEEIQIQKSNCFQNNRLSVTRILGNSQV